MAETITMPKLGFDMQEGTLIRWVRNEGESIGRGEVIAEIETDKATVEVESSAAGTVRKLLVDQGAVVPIGAAIAIVGSKDEKIEVPTTAQTKPAGAPAAEPIIATSPVPSGVMTAAAHPTAVGGEPTRIVRASPLAKRMASEAQVDLARVRGTGPGGRIVRKDIEQSLGGTVGAAFHAAGTVSRRPAGTGPEADQTVPLSKLRMAIARRMTESKTTAPHFYVTYEYRMDALLALREQTNSLLPADKRISVNDFLVKAVALNLREFPGLNSTYQGDTVLRHGAVNVGVAVAVDGGLLTVVCRNADQKGLREIAVEVRAMAARARTGKVHPQDIEGSTFSLSNLGMFEAENFAAIINPPEAAILAVGSARQVPVVQDGEVKPGWRMKATIAVDHRVSDGAEAARFMQALAAYIEQPLGLLLWPVAAGAEK